MTIRGDTGMMAPGLPWTTTGDLLSPGGTRNLVRPPERVRQGQGYLPTGGVVVVRRRRKAELQRDAASQRDVSRPSAGRSANTCRRHEEIIVIRKCVWEWLGADASLRHPSSSPPFEIS